LSKQLNSITQNKYEKIQDYAARVELALYRLLSEMTKDKTDAESITITKVWTSQAQNIFIDGLDFQIRTVLRAMKLDSLEEMIKAALEEEQALGNLKPKFEKTNMTTFSKPKCFNCEGYGHLSKDCRRPRKSTSNAGGNTSTFIKKEYSTSSSTMLCNYCKKPGHIVKDCRKLKYNNEKKSKSGEGSSTSTDIKTIGDLKNNQVLMCKNRGKQIIELVKNQVKVHSQSFKSNENTFLIDTGADLNLIKISAVNNNVPIELKTSKLQGIHETPIITLGIIKINLQINDNSYFDTIFHVVDDKFPIVVSGILGTPFFINNDMTLNLKKGEMIINVICIPPRSNNVVPIKFYDDKLNNNDIIIDRKNISDTLWLGTTLSMCTDRTIYANVINISENSVNLQVAQLANMNWELYTNSSEMKKQESAYESITSIKYFETNSVGQSLDIDFTDRIKTIIEQLITDHLNQEE